MTISRILIVFFLLGLSLKGQAQRISYTINSNWNFYKGTLQNIPQAGQEIQWEPVNIPHTWNDRDVMDDEPGYYRGEAWYRKKIYIPQQWKDKDVYVFFEGAAQVAEVFVNGKKVGSHTGSYTFFSFPITQYLKPGKDNVENELLVRLDNSHNEDIPPLSADFTFFGGLYRDVHLIAVNKVRFDMDNDASNGIFITTPNVSAERAAVNIRGSFVNNSASSKNITVEHVILDADGQTAYALKKEYKTAKGQQVSFSDDINDITKPHLWSTENPYLYRVVSTISDSQTQEILDEVSNPLGFRWYSFDAEKGFFLNGEPLKLIGASRHQDYKGKGNALSDALHIRDVELLKEMGGNFLRVAHYPQDPAVLQACDRLGILASVETSIVNRITETEAFAEHAKKMHLEMIRQNFNHPSLIIWAYMNEVLLRPRYEKGSVEQEAYFGKITKLAQELEDITRKEDPYRYTMIPNHGNFDLYNRVQLTKIPMLVGWNLYQGWYSDKFSGFANYLDRHRRELPDKPLLVTEYGGDADIRLHSFEPIRFDKTVEYTTRYHQAYLKAMMERPFVAAAMIWNLADFSSETRTESTPHINSKGILTLDRKPKDAYRFYQANLLKIPYLQIGTKEWNLRTGIAKSDTQLAHTQEVLVFSNQPTVTLKHNGKIIGNSSTAQGIARFHVDFVNGQNTLQALATTGDKEEITDQADIWFKMLPVNLHNKSLPFTEVNISLGDKRYFHDAANHQIWMPEKEYQPGSWGYIGGSIFRMENKARHSYGSDKDILGTDADPVYATQRTGIEQFKFDVPQGEYELTLHFAELLSDIQREELVYNLNGGGLTGDNFQERVFDVNINGHVFLKNLSNKEYLEPEKSVNFKTSVSVYDHQGITVDFVPKTGETILNGIQLRKIK
ncbi:beta-galactosidase [Parapedobacter sp. SGR-10]|uniref:glycoside hydrolase family 2 TIM barrel-domain containing protein n=1 Tax=Parapedobacter sp. SGR-10 TaxID=2710879 RepID=UPI0013D2A8BB|nr:glycoside hydrolase family 2 TIM barrel-domain containing protein [Parapedobacter sp. SGR-10]NGF55843.1 beta-galactosidase [Parapedobacter sp. SGR-10]